MTELFRRSARECAGLLRAGEISSRELVDAAIARIEDVDDVINALPTRCFERAREQAAVIDAERARGAHRLLEGLPTAIKDYNDVGGVRTTYGSPIFADNVPAVSDATVARLEANGAIPIAKSNVPEWAGGNTFNPVFGASRNPWNTSRSAGGSSGGSAAALASGQVWLATGNDLGGSLRTPAAFNGVVGLRPSPGCVPRGRRLQPFDTLWVEGPMARDVADVALMLDAGSGAHPDDPLAFDGHEGSFLAALEAPDTPARVGFSPDLGFAPVAREIRELTTTAVGRFTDLGTEVTDEAPDFSGAMDSFQTLRGVLLATMMGPLLAEHRDRIHADIIGNVELGLNISPHQIFAAERARAELSHRLSDFFQTHDFLVCPAVSIPPFPVEQRFVTAIDGVACETYIDWFAITFALTLTACPVLSLPCGFTAEGLPVAIQIVGRPRGEAALLRAAHQLESVLGVNAQLPINPRSA